MKRSKFVVAALASVSLLGVSGCVTDPNTGEQKISRTAVGGVLGAGAGALLGGVIGGKTGRIIGAVGGAAAGGYVGYRMDEQIKELREGTAGTGVDVTSIDGGDAILVNLPDGVTFARAQAVANYLTSQGVASSRIRWMGFGETQLKVQTGDNVAQPLNRRVEIKIIPFDAQDVNEARQQGM